jgi:NADPH:quinone reductase-like Zn-dependent oxidoreductase
MASGINTARAFWVTAPGESMLRETPILPFGENSVRVRSLFSGISRGTEALVFRNQVPVSEYEHMRAPFQEGAFPAPVKYGYSNVGVVEEGPAELRGETVFCLYPHQDRYVVPADAVIPLPDRLPAARAVLAANMETAVNGLWDAQPSVGSLVSVVGGGAVGCLAAALVARIPGTTVQLVDINPRRAELADKLGVTYVSPGQARDGADCVIHTSGTPDGLATALGLAGFEATVLEMSWYGDQSVPAPLGAAFHSKRLTLRSSQVGAVAPAMRPRWPHRRRLSLALLLLADSVFDCLITGEGPFEALPATMRWLADEPGDTICYRIRYDD